MAQSWCRRKRETRGVPVVFLPLSRGRGSTQVLNRVWLAANDCGRLRGNRRAGAVPAAGRSLDVHRFIRRRLGGPSLHRELGGDERLLIEPRRDVVALLGGILV